MIERILIAILTHLGSLLLAKGLERYSKTPQCQATSNDIDARLKAMEEAIREGLTGGPMTPEQRKKLHEAAINFTRSNNNNGSL